MYVDKLLMTSVYHIISYFMVKLGLNIIKLDLDSN